MRTQFIKLLPVAAVALILTSCGRDPKEPGSIYMPDMTYSNAYETYSASPFKNADGYMQSARRPVEGTIPRGWIPNDEKVKTNASLLMSYMAKNHFTHDPAKWQEEYDRAAATIADPLEFNDANLAEGKRLYEINCQVCHGEKGEGNGQIVELPNGGDGPYTARPPKYGDRLPQIKDGNIFYSVSYGKGMMGGYGYQLDVKERWQVIHYIKKLAGVNAPVAAATDSVKTGK
ncbi:MAG: cytochrome c [Chitinophagales bacterium]